jgi:hypothetical protein
LGKVGKMGISGSPGILLQALSNGDQGKVNLLDKFIK